MPEYLLNSNIIVHTSLCILIYNIYKFTVPVCGGWQRFEGTMLFTLAYTPSKCNNVMQERESESKERLIVEC